MPKITKNITESILPKHYQQYFIIVRRSSPYFSLNTLFILEDQFKCKHATINLIDKKTILLKDIEPHICFFDKNCNKDIYLMILKNYSIYPQSEIDILYFKNESYPYLPNYTPKKLRHEYFTIS